MSASDKKKLRKEQNQAKADAKKSASAKEAAKLKLYSIIFAAALVLMVLVFVATSIFSTGILEKSTKAVRVGEHTISSDMLNYFYIDQVYNWVNQYSDLISMFGLDVTKPLDQQKYLSSDNTWADNFLEQALATIQTTYALYDDAIAHGVTLSEDDNKTVKATLTSYGVQALQSGLNMNDYLVQLYGRGANADSFQEYLEVVQLATSYYTNYYNGLSYGEEDYQEAEKENYDKYSTYDYSYYFVSANDYREGGTKNENGTTVYTDEEKAAAVKKAGEIANFLLDDARKGTQALIDAALSLEINLGKKEEDLNYADMSLLFTELPEVTKDWVTDAQRKSGDATVLESTNTTKNDDGTETTTVLGYYVVIFGEKRTNEFELVNIRNILVSYDSTENAPTTAEKEATRKKAADLLLKWSAGENANEESFAKLADEQAGTTSANGGLAENVYPGALLDNLDEWVFADGRKAGDTTILETDYGYYILYYVGPNGTIYRDYMIDNELRDADAEEWYSALVEAVELELVTDRYVPMDLILYR